MGNNGGCLSTGLFEKIHFLIVDIIIVLLLLRIMSLINGNKLISEFTYTDDVCKFC